MKRRLRHERRMVSFLGGHGDVRRDDSSAGVSPGAIAMLVVYCFKSANPLHAPFAIPELLASVAVVLLHLKFRNPLLSIIVGTVLYMSLVQFVFA